MAVQPDNELRIEVKTHGFELRPDEFTSIETCLNKIRDAIADFPTKNLIITIFYHHRPEDFHVKTSLTLPSGTLFTGERNKVLYPAIESCVDKLLAKVERLKQQFESKEETTKQAIGTHHTLETTLDFDTKDLEDAIFFQDYLRFRRGLDGFEPALTEKIGRWVQRYPEIEEQFSDGILISDIVEDVFYHAYEHFNERSPDVPPGLWLESLVDPTIQDLLHFPESEFVNICYAKHRLEHSVR